VELKNHGIGGVDLFFWSWSTPKQTLTVCAIVFHFSPFSCNLPRCVRQTDMTPKLAAYLVSLTKTWLTGG